MSNQDVLATFLHISDLHLGHRFHGASGANGPDPAVPWSAKLFPDAEGLLGHHNIALDQLDSFFDDLRKEARTLKRRAPRVITTGDLTQDGHLAQLALATLFIGRRLPPSFREIGLAAPTWRRLAIAGNHDHWRGPKDIWPLVNVPKGKPAIDVDGEFGDPPALRIALPGNRHVEFIRIDTDADVGHDSDDRLYARGRFRSQLAELDRPADAGGLPGIDNRTFRVLLMHHSPAYRHGGNDHRLEIEDGSRQDLLHFIAKHRISVVLTGHIHDRQHDAMVGVFDAAGGWKFVEARCGSTTGREICPKWMKGAKTVQQNVLMVHRIVEDSHHRLWWETRTHYRRTPPPNAGGSAGFGSPWTIDRDAHNWALNARAIVWQDVVSGQAASSVDPSELSKIFTTF